jgi:hypothetical protein
MVSRPDLFIACAKMRSLRKRVNEVQPARTGSFARHCEPQAKQSRAMDDRLDRFAASLLAMTA